MTLFRIEVSRETGAVMLFMKVPCGFKPVIGWPHLDGMKEFANMLLDFYYSRKGERDKAEKLYDSLLGQALGDD